MQISRIEAIPVRIPLKPERRMISALGKHDVSDFVLVRMHTDEGIEGVGEATVTPRWSGETVWGAQAIIDARLRPRADSAATRGRSRRSSAGSTPSRSTTGSPRPPLRWHAGTLPAARRGSRSTSSWAGPAAR